MRIRIAAFVLAFAAAAFAAGEGFKARGFILPDGAVKVDDDRYRLPSPWDETVKFYRRAYPPAKYPRRTLHSQTALRAMHIENPERTEWEGVNLYEAGRGEVRVFILAPQQAPPAPPAKGKSP